MFVELDLFGLFQPPEYPIFIDLSLSDDPAATASHYQGLSMIITTIAVVTIIAYN
jgi:hypothetical protein